MKVSKFTLQNRIIRIMQECTDNVRHTGDPPRSRGPLVYSGKLKQWRWRQLYVTFDYLDNFSTLVFLKLSQTKYGRNPCLHKIPYNRNKLETAVERLWFISYPKSNLTSCYWVISVCVCVWIWLERTLAKYTKNPSGECAKRKLKCAKRKLIHST